MWPAGPKDQPTPLSKMQVGLHFHFDFVDTGWAPRLAAYTPALTQLLCSLLTNSSSSVALYKASGFVASHMG